MTGASCCLIEADDVVVLSGANSAHFTPESAVLRLKPRNTTMLPKKNRPARTSFVLSAVMSALLIQSPIAVAGEPVTCHDEWTEVIYGKEASAFMNWQDDLILAGQFVTSTSSIGRWDGVQIHGMGDGLNNRSFALTVYNSELVAGGNFTASGGNTVRRLARWDGENWHEIGGGISGTTVRSTLAFSDSLYVAGEFNQVGGELSVNNIARWDGQQWHTLGQGVNGRVYDMVVFNNELIVAGDFTNADGETVNNIARWDGSQWHSLDTGVNQRINALQVYKGDLYAGGRFTAAGSTSASYVARWDGTQWHALNNGVTDWVESLGIFQDELIVGGWFIWVDGQASPFIARWDGMEWHTVSDSFIIVAAIGQYNNMLYTYGYSGSYIGIHARGGFVTWPRGYSTETHQKFTWPAIDGATDYQFSVRDGSDAFYTKWYTAEELGCDDGGMCCLYRELPSGAGRWWIRPWSLEHGTGAWSAQYDFNINTKAPELLAPSGSVDDPSPTFVWRHVENATWYRLVITDSTGEVHRQWYSESTFTRHGDQCSVTPAGLILAPGPVKWTVQGWNVMSGHGMASNVMTAEISKIAQPETIGPLGVVPESQPSFTWQDVKGATWYEFVLVDLSVSESDPNRVVQRMWHEVGESHDLQCSDGECELTTNITLPIGPYIWWVRPWNAVHRHGPWSQNTVFFTLDMVD